MSGPGEHAGFAERLDWLQSSIDCSPGTDSRFSTESLIAVLACVSPGSDPLGRAGQWLADMKSGRTEITDLESRRYIAALEDLFRLPPGYFRDELIQREVDARIAFVAANASVRVIGPCRRSATAMTVGELHRIHVQIVEVLKRRRPAS
jgi:hypothetical protein